MPRFRRGSPGLDDHDADARVQAATVKVVTAVGYGSGVIISSDGLILTAKHVAVSDDDGVLNIPDLRATATVVYQSPDQDFAILRAHPRDGVALPQALACLPLVKRPLTPGSAIHAVGFPRRTQASSSDATDYSDGVRQLSTDGEILPYHSDDLGFLAIRSLGADIAGAAEARPLVLGSIRVIPGMSGGPVVGAGGELYGISIMGMHHSWPDDAEEMVGTFIGILPGSSIYAELYGAWGEERLVRDLRCDAVAVPAATGQDQFFTDGSYSYFMGVDLRYSHLFFAVASDLPEVMDAAGAAYCNGDQAHCPGELVSLMTTFLAPAARSHLLSAVWAQAYDSEVGMIADADLYPGLAPVPQGEAQEGLRTSLVSALTRAYTAQAREVGMPELNTEQRGRVRRAMAREVDRRWAGWHGEMPADSPRISVASDPRP
jgi:hypothetical protein